MYSIKKKNNILFIIQNASFPFDRRVSKEADSLIQNGYNVYVVCPTSVYDTEKRDTYNGISIYRFKNYLSNSTIKGFFIEYLNSIIKILAFSIYLIFKKKISVVHIANPPDFFWVLAVFCKIVKVKFIFDQHDLSPEMFKIRFSNRFIYKILLWNEKMTVKMSDFVIVVNNSFKKRLENKWKIDNKNCVVVYNGPLNNFQPRPNDNLIERYKNVHVILYVGLMTVTDNIEMVIEAAKKILCELNRTDCFFILLGDGSVRLKLEGEVQKLGISENVKFLGIVDPKIVMEYLYIADVCIAPDRPNGLNEYLTLIKIFEYMKARKPFVAFNLAETKNVAANSGLYAENTDEFADKILYLIDNPNFAKQLGETGYKLVMENFLWEKSEQELLSLYSKLTNSRK